MSRPRILLSVSGACAGALLTASLYSGNGADILRAQGSTTKVGNPVTGEGIPNPAPKVTRNWGQLPAGRTWGTSAGIDIDPLDGNIWAYERCGAGAAGGSGGGGVSCDTSPVDPVF